ncbi:hypothetical protein Agub_g10175, partial [Astrephomene gubernaculifera]
MEGLGRTADGGGNDVTGNDKKRAKEETKGTAADAAAVLVIDDVISSDDSATEGSPFSTHSVFDGGSGFRLRGYCPRTCTLLMRAASIRPCPPYTPPADDELQDGSTGSSGDGAADVGRQWGSETPAAVPLAFRRTTRGRTTDSPEPPPSPPSHQASDVLSAPPSFAAVSSGGGASTSERSSDTDAAGGCGRHGSSSITNTGTTITDPLCMTAQCLLSGGTSTAAGSDVAGRRSLDGRYPDAGTAACESAVTTMMNRIPGAGDSRGGVATRPAGAGEATGPGNGTPVQAPQQQHPSQSQRRSLTGYGGGMQVAAEPAGPLSRTASERLPCLPGLHGDAAWFVPEGYEEVECELLVRDVRPFGCHAAKGGGSEGTEGNVLEAGKEEPGRPADDGEARASTSAGAAAAVSKDGKVDSGGSAVGVDGGGNTGAAAGKRRSREQGFQVLRCCLLARDLWVKQPSSILEPAASMPASAAFAVPCEDGHPRISWGAGAEGCDRGTRRNSTTSSFSSGRRVSRSVSFSSATADIRPTTGGRKRSGWKRHARTVAGGGGAAGSNSSSSNSTRNGATIASSGRGGGSSSSRGDGDRFDGLMRLGYREVQCGLLMREMSTRTGGRYAQSAGGDVGRNRSPVLPPAAEQRGAVEVLAGQPAAPSSGALVAAAPPFPSLALPLPSGVAAAAAAALGYREVTCVLLVKVRRGLG